MNKKKPETISPENLIILEDNLADNHDEKTILDENTIILASGDAYSVLNVPAIKSALKEAGLSYEDVAEQENISVSSIYKLLSQTSKSPSFFNTIAVIRASGLSADEVCGIKPTRHINKNHHTHAPTHSESVVIDRLDKLENIILRQSKLIEDLNAEIKRLSPASRDDY